MVILEPVVIQDSPDPIIISDSPAARPVAPSSKKYVASPEAKLNSARTQQSANKNSETKLSGEAKLASSSRTKPSLSSSGKSTQRVHNAEERTSPSKPEPDPASRCHFQNVFVKFKSDSVIGNKAQLGNGEVKPSPCSDNDRKSSSKRTLKVGNDNSCSDSDNSVSESTERNDVNKGLERCNNELNDLPVESNIHSCPRDGSSTDNAIDVSESNVYSECGGGGIGSPCEVDEKVSSECSGICAKSAEMSAQKGISIDVDHRFLTWPSFEQGGYGTGKQGI